MARRRFCISPVGIRDVGLEGLPLSGSRPTLSTCRNDRETELGEALDQFCEEWSLGTPDNARFEMEYLLAVGTRT